MREVTKTVVEQQKKAYKDARETYIATRLAKNVKFCLNNPYMVFCKILHGLNLCFQIYFIPRTTDMLDLTISYTLVLWSLAIVLARGQWLVRFGLVDELPYKKRRNKRNRK